LEKDAGEGVWMRSIGVTVALLLGAGPEMAKAETRLLQPLAIDRASQAHSESYRPLLLQEPMQPRSSVPLSASLMIAPNASVGFGKFDTPPRRRVSLQDQPVSLHAKKVKRAAVGLSLRF
jgi:hypothetical protein